MKLKLIFPLMLAAAFLLPNAMAQTNSASAATNDVSLNAYLQIQEQLHAARLAIEETRLASTEEAKKNADALALRLQSLEQALSAQRASDTDASRKTQQLIIILAGAFGLAGLAIMLLMAYFQWRAFTQLAQVSMQHHTAIAQGTAVHELAAPGRAAVETSSARLLAVVGHLEKRIQELEGEQRVLPGTGPEKPASPLAEAQSLLDANQPQAALDFLEKFLTAQPQHAEALAKKAIALEKLGRTADALACCDRAIAADDTLAVAYLHKGGLLNRLRRYDEALNCYEQALVAQEKKAKVS